MESDWDWNFIFNDYIDLSTGLIKREIISKSLEIMSSNSPYPEGYYKVTSVSKFVRVTKP